MKKNEDWQEFQVGQRVRVDLVDIPKKDRQCEVGVVMAVTTRFARTPELRQVRYHVRFDRPYIKPSSVLYIIYRHPTFVGTSGLCLQNQCSLLL